MSTAVPGTGNAMTDPRVIVSAALCIFFLSVVALAAGYSQDARLVPLIVGLTGLVLSALQFADDVRATRASPVTVPTAAWILVGWFGGFVALVLILGLLAGAFVSVAAFMHVHGRERLITAIGVAGAFVLTLWLTLSVIMELDLYAGFTGLS